MMNSSYIELLLEYKISSPPLQMCRALSLGMGDAYFSRGWKAPAESCEAACVHEQVARRIANIRFTWQL